MTDAPESERYRSWPAEKREEILRNWRNRKVGTRIVSETDALRIWHLILKPGERAPFHRHDEPYFWTVMGPGKSRSYYHDGAVADAVHEAGDTRHYSLQDGEFFVHDLENIGETPLEFVTVEFKK